MDEIVVTTPREELREGELERVKPVRDIARARPCLSCGEAFESAGWHNRLCPRCRKRGSLEPF